MPTLTLSAPPITGTTPMLVFTSSAPIPVLSTLLFGFKKAAVPGY